MTPEEAVVQSLLKQNKTLATAESCTGGLIAKRITDVPGALAMRNAILYIDRADAPLPEGQFYLADLYGLEVRDAQSGEVLGKLEDVLTLPANNVYVVRGGEREWMIPAVPEFIAETNVQEGYVRVNLMEGL